MLLSMKNQPWLRRIHVVKFWGIKDIRISPNAYEANVEATSGFAWAHKQVKLDG